MKKAPQPENKSLSEITFSPSEKQRNMDTTKFIYIIGER